MSKTTTTAGLEPELGTHTSYYIQNYKWVPDLSAQTEAAKPPEGNGKIFMTLVRRRLLSYDTNTMIRKRKPWQGGLHQNWKLPQKPLSLKWKYKPGVGRKMCAKHRPDERLVSGIYKIPKLGNKTNSPMKCGQRFEHTWPKKIMNGREAHKHMFNIWSHWRNTTCTQKEVTQQNLTEARAWYCLWKCKMAQPLQFLQKLECTYHMTQQSYC